MPDLAIETESLRKHFDRTVAVADLSLAIRRGEVFGFLGPNGAGKTTSLKLLLGLIEPTGGAGIVLGAPLGSIKPSSSLSDVVLPAPFGPRKPNTSPRRIERDRSATASVRSKCLRSDSVSIARSGIQRLYCTLCAICSVSVERT